MKTDLETPLVTTLVTKEYIKSMDKYRQKPKDSSIGLLAACENNIVLFAEKMVGFKLRAWQVDFLNRVQRAIHGDYPTREFLLNTSRQIGKSTCVAILSLWALTFNKCPGTVHNNTIVGIVSASDGQSRKLVQEINKFIAFGDMTMKEAFGEEKFFSDLVDEKQANNTQTITFKPSNYQVEETPELLRGSKAGSMIKSFAPTSSILGETFSIIIIDEAGKSDKISDEFFLDYAYPTGNSCDAIRIYTSTPWVLSGFFYEKVDPDNNKDKHTEDRLQFDIDAIKIEDPKLHTTVMKITTDMNDSGKTDEVQRAYYCRFVKGESTFFKPDKVKECFVEDTEMVQSYTKDCDLAIDFGGQTTSKTVITITSCDEDGLIQRLHHKTYEVQKDDTIIEDIASLMKKFNIQRIIPDDCPQGDYLMREMVNKGWNVCPMKFATDKIKKFMAFRSMLNKGLIKSYPDEGLKTEMFALEMVQGVRNTMIKHAPGYSDDHIDSFIMSCYFFVEEDNEGKYYDIDDIDINNNSAGWW